MGALDNIDHNPSSTTAIDSFHGAGISFIQFPTSSNKGCCQNRIQLSSAEKNHQLPSEYTIVPAVVQKKEEVTVPESCSLEIVRGDSNVSLRSAMLEENGWLEHAIKILGKSNLEKDDAM